MIDKQHKLINRKINTVEKDLKVIESQIGNISLENDFLTTSMLANNVIFSLKHLMTTLLDAITNIYNGKFNFHLLTPVQLRHELSVITEQIPNDLSLPIKKSDSLAEMYNLLRVQARVTANFIIFQIKIPLIAKETYEILRLILIPHLIKNNTEVTILPVSSYVAVNLKQDSFMRMEDEDLKLSIEKNPFTTLCHLKTPVYVIKNRGASAAAAGAVAHAARAPAAAEPLPPAPRARAAAAAKATAGQVSPPIALCSDQYSEISEFTKNRARVSLKNKCTASNVQSASARVVVQDIGSSPIVQRSVFKPKDEL